MKFYFRQSDETIPTVCTLVDSYPRQDEILSKDKVMRLSIPTVCTLGDSYPRQDEILSIDKVMRLSLLNLCHVTDTLDKVLYR